MRVGEAVLGEETREQKLERGGSQSVGGGLAEATSEQSGEGGSKMFEALGEATGGKQMGGGSESCPEHSAVIKPPLDSAKMEGGGGRKGGRDETGEAAQERGGDREAHSIFAVLSRGGGCVMIGVSAESAAGVESILGWGVRRAAWGGGVGEPWWPGGRCWNPVGGFREVSKEKDGRKWHPGEWSIQDGRLTGGWNLEENCRLVLATAQSGAPGWCGLRLRGLGSRI